MELTVQGLAERLKRSIDEQVAQLQREYDLIELVKGSLMREVSRSINSNTSEEQHLAIGAMNAYSVVLEFLLKPEKSPEKS